MGAAGLNGPAWVVALAGHLLSIPSSIPLQKIEGRKERKEKVRENLGKGLIFLDS